MVGIYEVTVALIKPDVVRRKAIGEVLAFMEHRFDIVDMGVFHWQPEHVSAWYAEHALKDWFPSFVEFMTSTPMVHVLLGGAGAVSAWRKAMGATDPTKAEPGTVRHQWGSHRGPIMCNAVHGSDSPDRVLFELDYIQSMIQPGFGRSIRFAPWLRASTVRASERPTSVADEETSRFLPVAELERRYMLHVLRSVDGNKSKAARILGYDRRTLYRKLARLTLSEQQPSEPFELRIS